eukprot:1366351-Amorphochlora_amoeboformis.AAC.1
MNTYMKHTYTSQSISSEGIRIDSLTDWTEKLGTILTTIHSIPVGNGDIGSEKTALAQNSIGARDRDKRHPKEGKCAMMSRGVLGGCSEAISALSYN